MNKIIMVDVDGILFPFQAAYGYALRGTPFADDEIQVWREIPGTWTDEQREQALVASHSYDLMHQFGFYPAAVKAMKVLNEHGIHIALCTRRNENKTDDLLQVIEEQGLHADSVYCARDVDKIAWCQERGISVIFDDKPSTIIRAADANMHVFALKWPYNCHIEHSRVTVSEDWSQLTQGILDCFSSS